MCMCILGVLVCEDICIVGCSWCGGWIIGGKCLFVSVLCKCLYIGLLVCLSWWVGWLVLDWLVVGMICFFYFVVGILGVFIVGE